MAVGVKSFCNCWFNGDFEDCLVDNLWEDYPSVGRNLTVRQSSSTYTPNSPKSSSPFLVAVPSSNKAEASLCCGLSGGGGDFVPIAGVEDLDVSDGGPVVRGGDIARVLLTLAFPTAFCLRLASWTTG
jgi:hypothetical protein